MLQTSDFLLYILMGEITYRNMPFSPYIDDELGLLYQIQISAIYGENCSPTGNKEKNHLKLCFSINMFTKNKSILF